MSLLCIYKMVNISKISWSSYPITSLPSEFDFCESLFNSESLMFVFFIHYHLLRHQELRRYNIS